MRTKPSVVQQSLICSSILKNLQQESVRNLTLCNPSVHFVNQERVNKNTINYGRCTLQEFFPHCTSCLSAAWSPRMCGALLKYHCPHIPLVQAKRGRRSHLMVAINSALRVCKLTARIDATHPQRYLWTITCIALTRSMIPMKMCGIQQHNIAKRSDWAK